MNKSATGRSFPHQLQTTSLSEGGTLIHDSTYPPFELYGDTKGRLQQCSTLSDLMRLSK
jgi:hypothetical protein